MSKSELDEPDLIMERLTDTTLRQRAWMKEQGIDVDKILRDADINAMQILSVTKDRTSVETLNKDCPLSMRIKRRAHEPIRELVYMDTKPILQRGK